MTELDGLPQATRERIEHIGSADVVIGMPACGSVASIASAADAARQAIEALRPAGKTVLIHSDGAPVGGSGEQPGHTGDGLLNVFACPMQGGDRFPGGTRDPGEPYRTLFRISRALGAHACGVLTSGAESITSQAVHSILEPVIAHGIDLAVSCYARGKFEGLINSSIAYPLTRALYGKRIHAPMSSDLGFSASFMDKSLGESGTPAVRALGTVWIPTYAVLRGLQVGEVHIGVKPAAPPSSADLSTVVTDVVGSLYSGMEQNAAFWQRIRGSQAVRAYGKPEFISEDTGAVDVSNMIEAFQLGYKNLLDVWGLFLPPAALVELKKLTRVAAEQFRIPDELWARMVYDFGLGYRLRPISRDHLLRAMTPLYLGWVASYALEVRNAEPDTVEDRLERLCAVYETQKLYLLSRWRWPDRFNP